MRTGHARLTLGGVEAEGADGLKLSEAPLRGMITLRGDLGETAFANALEGATGLAVPSLRRGAYDGDRGALWMSPDELLLMLPYGEVGETLTKLAKALDGQHHLAVDVSDARAVFRLEGSAAREVLAKGAPVDLSPDAFGDGDVRRTRIGQVAAAFTQVASEPDTFEIVCFRSYARYLWDWLVASSVEGTMPGALAAPRS